LTYTWSQLTGPGTTLFTPNGTTSSNTTWAQFSHPGLYELEVVVTDGSNSLPANLTVEVYPAKSDPDAVAHWTFDESTGNMALDSSGAYDGALVGNPVWTPSGGQVEGALYFNGTDAHVDVSGVTDSLNGKTGITVSMWVKSDSVDVDSGLLHHGVANGADDGLAARFDKTGASGGGTRVMKLTLATTDGLAQVESSEHVQTTDWMHIAYTWEDGQPLRLFLNGQEDSSPTFTRGAKSGTIHIPSTLLIGAGPKSRWKGYIDEVKVYNRALTPAELAEASYIDNDMDGMRDTWEQTHFPGVGTDGTGDADDDGIREFFEYLFGSDPHDELSKGDPFRVIPDPAGPGAVFMWRVTAGMQAGKDYEVRVATDLSGSWHRLPEGEYTITETTTDGMTTVELTFHAQNSLGSNVFVRLQGPPTP
jgi:hypothetical protein